MRYHVTGSITLSARARRPAWEASDSGATAADALIRLARRARDFLRNRHRRNPPNLGMQSYCLIITGNAKQDDLLPNEEAVSTQVWLDEFLDQWYKSINQQGKAGET
jgi:hypothetical protein